MANSQTRTLKRTAYRTKLSARNSSGTLGVFRSVRAGAPRWVATWQDIDDGRIRRREFSVARWGEDGAREQAHAERQRQERLLAEAFGLPGVVVQRCAGRQCDGWQVRWWEPVSDGAVRATLFFGCGRYGARAESEAQAFAERVRRRLATPP